MENEVIHIQFEGSLVDYIKFQVRYCVPLDLSEGELTLVAYIFLYKDQATDKLLLDGRSKSHKSVENYMSSLRKKSLIIGKGLNPELYLSKDSTNHVYTFKVDQ